MRAIVLEDLVGPAGLRLREIDAPGDRGGVLIDVAAAGVNHPDLLQTHGRHQTKLEPPFIPGSEVAGTVVSAPVASGFEPGDRVLAISGTGGFADRVVVPVEMVHRAPVNLSLVESVAMIANHQTAYFALVDRAGLRASDSVLVLGAAGGVGSAAVQIASQLDAQVIAGVHRGGAGEFVRSLDPSHVVRLKDSWWEEIRELTGGRGVDLVFDPIGGRPFDDALRVIAPGGRHVTVGFAAGAVPTVALNRLLLRNVAVIGAGWGAYLQTDPGALRRVASGLERLTERGLRPPIMRTFPLEEARAAMEMLENGEVLGKVVLRIGEAAAPDENETTVTPSVLY